MSAKTGVHTANPQQTNICLEVTTVLDKMKEEILEICSTISTRTVTTDIIK